MLVMLSVVALCIILANEGLKFTWQSNLRLWCAPPPSFSQLILSKMYNVCLSVCLFACLLFVCQFVLTLCFFVLWSWLRTIGVSSFSVIDGRFSVKLEIWFSCNQSILSPQEKINYFRNNSNSINSSARNSKSRLLLIDKQHHHLQAYIQKLEFIGV